MCNNNNNNNNNNSLEDLHSFCNWLHCVMHSALYFHCSLSNFPNVGTAFFEICFVFDVRKSHISKYSTDFSLTKEWLGKSRAVESVKFYYCNAFTLHARVGLSPVYTIQPVVSCKRGFTGIAVVTSKILSEVIDSWALYGVQCVLLLTFMATVHPVFKPFYRGRRFLGDVGAPNNLDWA